MRWLSKFKSSVRKLKSVIAPYCTTQKRKEHIAIACAWVAAHLLEFAALSFFVKEAESEDTESSVWRPVVTNFGNIIFNGGMYAFKIAMSNYMVHSLADSLMKANALDGWLNDEASVGIDFIQSMEQGSAFALAADTPVERVLSEHLKSLSKGTIKLTVEIISRILSSLSSLYVMGRLTNLKTASVYFGLGAALVAACCKLDNARIKMSIENSEHDDTINARLTHIRERASQILALGGEELEAERINAILADKTRLAKRILAHESRNNSVLYIIFFGLGPFLSTLAAFAPSVLEAPPISSVAALLFQQHVFQLMINFFLAMENYTQEYPKFGLSLEKTHALQALLSLWREVQQEKSLVQHYPEENSWQTTTNLILKTFSLEMPSRLEEVRGQKLLENVNLTLTPGYYQLLGPSNAGKSTTFKAFMGFWPHSSGEIFYPCAKNKIRFIPQETFIPYDATIIEMIVYPKKNATVSQRREIIQLLRKLNLTHLTSSLDKKENLNKLSRGEQQRLAIIGAIITRPKLLLMDEATASMDENNKKMSWYLIKKYLFGAVIIAIDHGALALVDDPLTNRSENTQIVDEPFVSLEEAKEALPPPESHYIPMPDFDSEERNSPIEMKLMERLLPDEKEVIETSLINHERPQQQWGMHATLFRKININHAKKTLELMGQVQHKTARRNSAP